MSFGCSPSTFDRYIVKTICSLNKHKYSYLVVETQPCGEKKRTARENSFFIGSPPDRQRFYCSVIVRILQPCRGDCNDTDLHLSKFSPLQECSILHLLWSGCMTSFLTQVNLCTTVDLHIQLTGICHCVHIWVGQKFPHTHKHYMLLVTTNNVSNHVLMYMMEHVHVHSISQMHRGSACSKSFYLRSVSSRCHG